MKDALVIPAQGAPYKAEIPTNKELEELQRLVGGFIEYVPVYDEEQKEVGLSLFCNEEGKIDGLPVNLRATHYFGFALQKGDVLVGDIVIMGPPDDDGETLPLDEIDDWVDSFERGPSEVDLKRWDDWRDLRERKAKAEEVGDESELAKLALEEEALRDRGQREVMEQDLTQPERWWWLSFADPKKPKGEQFLGVIITMGGGVGEITQKLWDMGINPGGEVQAVPYPDGEDPPPEQYRNKLLSKAQLEEAGLA